MIHELHGFVNKHWQKSNNGLMQVIIVNVLVFVSLLLVKVLLVIAGYGAYYQLVLQRLYLPASWEGFWQQPWSLLSHFWVHTQFFPLFWNLLLLHLFGQVVMDLLGSRHFLAMYCLGGLAGGLLFLLLHNALPHFQDFSLCLSGMEASLYAIMAAAATLAPRFSFGLFLLGRIQLKYIVGFALLLAFYSLASDYAAEGIAQLGGALLGYVYVKQVVGLSTKLRALLSCLKRPFKRSRFKVSTKGTPLQRQSTSRGQDRSVIEALLDKVARSGYESLTAAEKQKLFDAGK